MLHSKEEVCERYNEFQDNIHYKELLQSINTYVTPYFFRAFGWGCRAYNVMNETISNILEENEFLRNFVTEASYMFKCFISFMTGQRMESRDLPWFSTYGLIEDPHSLTQSHKLMEHKHLFFSSECFSDLFGGKSQKEYAIQNVVRMGSNLGTDSNLGGTDSNILSPLIILKGWQEMPIYLVRRGPFEINSIHPFDFHPAPVRFLSVEYTHPEMPEAIELKMDHSWWIVGNELFTPSFVLRMLEYQSVHYYFDKDYKIRMMDDLCTLLEFGSDTYMELVDDGYMWKKEIVFEKDIYDGCYDADSDTDSGGPGFVRIDGEYIKNQENENRYNETKKNQ
jgi:hypothetical protein